MFGVDGAPLVRRVATLALECLRLLLAYPGLAEPAHRAALMALLAAFDAEGVQSLPAEGEGARLAGWYYHQGQGPAARPPCACWAQAKGATAHAQHSRLLENGSGACLQCGGLRC